MSSSNDAPRLAWQDAPPTADNVGEVWVIFDDRPTPFIEVGTVTLNGDRINLFCERFNYPVDVMLDAQWARLPLPEGAS